MNIIARLNEITGLPTLPEVMVQVQSLVNSDEGNAGELAKIVNKDLALSSKLLKVANSAFYGAPNQRIASVPTAITRIGFNEVRNITMAVSLVKRFPRKSQVLPYDEFWQHSLTAGFLAQHIGGLCGDLLSDRDREVLFISGLLHDIGILVYDQFFHEEFKGIFDCAREEEISFLQAEQRVAGREPHPSVGSALMELWKLDASVVSGARYHHAPGKASEAVMKPVCVVALTEFVLCNWSLGSLEGTVEDLDAGVWRTLGLKPESHAEIAKAAEKELEKAKAILFEAADGELKRI